MDLSEFYTGSMAAPDKGPNGTLVQSQRYAAPASISDLYGGMYSETGAAPTKRTVQTIPVTDYAAKNRNDTVADKPAPLVAAPSSPNYTDAAGALDANRMGFTVDFSNPATKAIASATKPSGFDPIGYGPLGFGELLGFLYDSDPSAGGLVSNPGALVAAPSRINTGDAWGGMRTAPGGSGQQGLVTGTPGGAAPAPQNNSPIAETFGAHNTSSPEAFAASVTRPTTVPGAQQFTGTVQQGQGGQNRYGSTARNELLALFG